MLYILENIHGVSQPRFRDGNERTLVTNLGLVSCTVSSDRAASFSQKLAFLKSHGINQQTRFPAKVSTRTTPSKTEDVSRQQ